MLTGFSQSSGWYRYPNPAVGTAQVEAAARLVKDMFPESLDGDQPSVFSSWGPYTQISGTASKTNVPGVTSARAPSSTKKETAKAR